MKYLPVVVGLGLVILVTGSVLAVNAMRTSKATPAPSASTSMSGSMQMHASKSDTAVETTSVMIDNYAFSPTAIKVKVGETVTWTNMDTVRHNVVADTASSDAPNGPLIARGETYSFTFKKAGTYTYHCMPHPYMKASVTVTE